MAYYLLAAHHHSESPFNLMTDHTEVWQDLVALDTELRAANALVFSRGLTAPDAAKTVRITEAGEVTETDGPYQQLEHWLSGMWIIETPDQATALEWARKAAAAHRCDVEVRPFQGQVTGAGVQD